jgi:hypothetical protein
MEVSVITYKMLIWVFLDVLLIMFPLSKIIRYILRLFKVLIGFHDSFFINYHYLLK